MKTSFHTIENGLKSLNRFDAIGDPHATLHEIRDCVNRNDEVFPVRARFKLTKTYSNYSAAWLLRDFRIEKAVHRWVQARGGFEKFIEKYHQYDPTLREHHWPPHFPVKVIAGCGSIASGRNIFLFFPQCLGIEPRNKSDVFGFELIDVWRTRFEQVILPCVRRVFDPQTQFDCHTMLESQLQETTYLASVFHEIGHRVGPFRVSPSKHPQLQINPFHLDVLGELSTDALSVMLLKFPELACFVIFYRLFSYGRQGFADNPTSASINEDNDAWGGSYLWNKCLQSRCITKNGDKWHLNLEVAPTMFRQIVDEIHTLGLACLECENDADAIISNWMRRQVHWNAENHFVLPESLRQVFQLCQDIPETSQYTPMFNWTDLTPTR